MCCHSGSSATINEWKPRTTETSSWWKRPWQPALFCFTFKLQLFYYLTHWLPITNEFNIWVAILWLSFKNLSDEIDQYQTDSEAVSYSQLLWWLESELGAALSMWGPALCKAGEGWSAIWGTLFTPGSATFYPLAGQGFSFIPWASISLGAAHLSIIPPSAVQWFRKWLLGQFELWL